MPLKVEDLPLTPDPYSHERMSFLKPQHAMDLGAVLQLYVIENGSREARENWQRAQQKNLFRFALERSAFWKARLGASVKIDKIKLSALPVLTRSELNRQVADEGCLIQPVDRMPTIEGITSGSSGTPTRFFWTEVNKRYQNFSTVLDLIQDPVKESYNRTFIQHEPELKTAVAAHEKLEDYGLNDFFRPQSYRTIRFNGVLDDALINELRKRKIGQLTTFPWIFDFVVKQIGLSGLKKYGCSALVFLGGNVESDLIEQLQEASISVRSTYSCREVGGIGYSCPKFPRFYHVVNTNVCVEVVAKEKHVADGGAGNVLITALHSYATPFIRYELGDLATYYKRCPCGHDGPVLTDVYGRSKNFIKLADGTLRYFFPLAQYHPLLAQYKEYRFIQADVNTMRVFIGGRSEISEAEREGLSAIVKAAAGVDLSLEITCCETIDWGGGTKRLPFRCDAP